MYKTKVLNKQFTNFNYSRDKTNRRIKHKIENLPTDEILLIIILMRLSISSSTNKNFIRPDGINIRHLKHQNTSHQIPHKHVQHCPQH